MNKSRNSDREQLTGCFKCGKHAHIVKNCPLLKEEQEQEQFQKQGEKQVANRSANSYARCLSRAMLAAWGDSTEEEEEGTEEEEAAVALISRSDSETYEESLDSLDQLKEQVCGISKAKLKELLFTLMDECDALTSENCMLKVVCAEIKKGR